MAWALCWSCNRSVFSASLARSLSSCSVQESVLDGNEQVLLAMTHRSHTSISTKNFKMHRRKKPIAFSVAVKDHVWRDRDLEEACSPESEMRSALSDLRIVPSC